MNKIYFDTIFQIITTGHWITDEVTRALKKFDITEPQFNVLRILKGARGKPLTVSTIQTHMVQRSSNVTRIIDKLLRKNLVERKECPTNRRKMDITITEEGIKKLDELNEEVLTLHKPFFDKLNDEELITLKNLILKLKS